MFCSVAMIVTSVNIKENRKNDFYKSSFQIYSHNNNVNHSNEAIKDLFNDLYIDSKINKVLGHLYIDSKINWSMFLVFLYTLMKIKKILKFWKK